MPVACTAIWIVVSKMLTGKTDLMNRRQNIGGVLIQISLAGLADIFASR